LAQSGNTSVAREIARIDHEYSDLSVAKGMPAASVEYFAEDGVAFGPTAVNGKKYWASRSDFPGTLIWQPIFAFVSVAGELGYTTGVWELKKGNEPSLGFGHYVTIWAKQRSEKWKIALDVGTDIANRRLTWKSFPLTLSSNRATMPAAIYAKPKTNLPARRGMTSAKPSSIAPPRTSECIATSRSQRSD